MNRRRVRESPKSGSFRKDADLKVTERIKGNESEKRGREEKDFSEDVKLELCLLSVEVGR